MSETIIVPWTQEQVDALNRHQQSGAFHGYTCEQSEHGLLLATPSGWICSSCTYRQNWAHDPGLTGEDQPEYSVIAYEEHEHGRIELRESQDGYQMVRLRRRVGGGWYVRDEISVAKPLEAGRERVVRPSLRTPKAP